MSTFIGNIEAKMDEKGRIFVPAVYRKILAEEESRTLVMRRDTDNACLVFYPEEVWNRKVEQLKEALDEWDPEDQLILMQFMADAEFVEMDSQGRILISKKNLENIEPAGVCESVCAGNQYIYVGMLDRFTLWNPEVYRQKMVDQRDLAAKIRAKMNKK